MSGYLALLHSLVIFGDAFLDLRRDGEVFLRAGENGLAADAQRDIVSKYHDSIILTV